MSGFSDLVSSFALGSAVILGVALVVELSLERLRVAPRQRHRLMWLAAVAVLMLPVFGWLVAEPSLSRSLPEAIGTHAVVPRVGVMRVESVSLPGPWDETQGFASWGGLVWLAGTFAGLAFLSVQFIRSRRLVMDSRAMPRSVLRDYRARGLARAQLRVSNRVTGAVCIGTWRPVVLVPAEFESWPRARREMVLRHEVAHAERRDELSTILILLMRSGCWWNPLAWWLTTRCIRLREMAADDRVLGEGWDPLDYAEVLLRIAREASAPDSVYALGIQSSESLLKRRVQRLVGQDFTARPTGVYSGVALAALAVTSSVVVHVGRGPGVAELVSASTTGPASDRCEALFALAGRPSGKWFFAVLPMAADPDPAVRATAVWTLSRIGCTPAFLTVMHALEDPSARVRGVAVRSLSEFKPWQLEQDPQTLFRWLPGVYQRALVKWVGRPEGRNSKQLLESRAGDRAPWVRAGAKRALGRFAAESP